MSLKYSLEDLVEFVNEEGGVDKVAHNVRAADIVHDGTDLASEIKGLWAGMTVAYESYFSLTMQVQEALDEWVTENDSDAGRASTGNDYPSDGDVFSDGGGKLWVNNRGECHHIPVRLEGSGNTGVILPESGSTPVDSLIGPFVVLGRVSS